MPIWRWVAMPIRSEAYEKVRSMLLSQAPHTRAFPGCLSLVLYEGEGPTFYSLSSWETTEALEAYRRSPLFRRFWEELKPYFRDSAQAVSLKALLGV
ncbi:MAG: antibiotic biosynthesis monooxygenase [Bacteroidia bacterium]|nr:antibiotic biosynthesis monooxygenase [Bacteroidia bacterium]